MSEQLRDYFLPMSGLLLIVSWLLEILTSVVGCDHAECGKLFTDTLENL